jgi:hypothetical protein
MEKTSSLGIEDWAGQSDIVQCGSYGRGDARMIAWERDDCTRAIETNGNPIWEGEEGFEAAWELCTSSVVPFSATSGTK